MKFTLLGLALLSFGCITLAHPIVLDSAGRTPAALGSDRLLTNRDLRPADEGKGSGDHTPHLPFRNYPSESDNEELVSIRDDTGDSGPYVPFSQYPEEE
ncbi:hypothetical protein DFH06DRAFT_439778 [Mycena polygramma]|nr:hypothetical protein DFH06DRAFT_439778 [Mycena polygramma]